MNRQTSCNSPKEKCAAKASSETDSDFEVWKYLESGESFSHSTKKKRLENARKFLKMSQVHKLGDSGRRNKFTETELKSVNLDEIQLPPSTEAVVTVNKACSSRRRGTEYNKPPPPSHKPDPPPPNYNQFFRRVSEKVDLKYRDGNKHLHFVKSETRTSVMSVKDESGRELNRLEKVREWIPESNMTSQNNEGTGLRFRFLSYNVLAQQLLEMNQQLYKGMNPVHLAWENRWRDIQREIRQFSPHIVCLQEVQFQKPNHFRTHYLPFFEQLGYRAVFKSRTGDKKDGCAIFYKLDMFKLDQYSLVEYLIPRVPVLDRDNIGVVCRLIPRGRTDIPPLVVGTTHLLFNKKRTDIRLAQIGVFLAEVDRLSFCAGEYCPVIISGDFNDTTTSEVYQLINNGYIEYQGAPRGGSIMPRQLVPPSIGLTDTCQWEQVLHGRNEIPGYGSGKFSHRFSFNSVYSDWEQHDSSNRVVSTNHGDWTIVDFIFYTNLNRRGSLNLVSRLLLPRSKDMESIGRIPSDICPSDHFPLLADFILGS